MEERLGKKGERLLESLPLSPLISKTRTYEGLRAAPSLLL
jgi:hypothetical protein